MSRLRISLLVALCTACVLVNCSPRRDNIKPSSKWGNVNIFTPDNGYETDITPYNPDEFAPTPTRENQWRKARLAMPLPWGFDVQNRCPAGQVWREAGYCSNVPEGDDEYGR